MTKQEQRDEALQVCKAIKILALEEYEANEISAYEACEVTRKSAEKECREKLAEIDRQ